MRLHRVVVVALSVAALNGGSALADQRKKMDPERIWKQRWEKASESERDWARSTSACETRGMSRAQGARANTGNGYLGGFQYDEQTWWAAPNTGGKRGDAHQLPHLEPWLTQAVVSVKKMRRDGTGPWPNCG